MVLSAHANPRIIITAASLKWADAAPATLLRKHDPGVFGGPTGGDAGPGMHLAALGSLFRERV